MLKRNSYKERNSYVQEHTWSEAFEHLAVSVAQLNLDGRLLSANEHMCELIGLPKRDLLEKSLNDLFLPEGSWSECKGGLDQLIAGEIPHYSTTMRAVRTDGQGVWMDIVFSLVRDDVTNMPRSLTAVATDITFLKRTEQELREAQVVRDDLSRKMMTAQEADRTRIARELHDDIGQSLAVLKIQILRAGQPVSGHPEMTHASLKDLRCQAGKDHQQGGAPVAQPTLFGAGVARPGGRRKEPLPRMLRATTYPNSLFVRSSSGEIGQCDRPCLS